MHGLSLEDMGTSTHILHPALGYDIGDYANISNEQALYDFGAAPEPSATLCLLVGAGALNLRRTRHTES